MWPKTLKRRRDRHRASERRRRLHTVQWKTTDSSPTSVTAFITNRPTVNQGTRALGTDRSTGHPKGSRSHPRGLAACDAI